MFIASYKHVLPWKEIEPARDLPRSKVLILCFLEIPTKVDVRTAINVGKIFGMHIFITIFTRRTNKAIINETSTSTKKIQNRNPQFRKI